jgi:ubiquinone/menaquinone biosynthesis C-methylase UbiE
MHGEDSPVAAAQQRRGPTSYGLQSPESVFGAMGLKDGDVFLDAGCGKGDYSLEAARIVGSSGLVYALDVAPGYVEGLASEAASLGILQLRAMQADITASIPLPDASVDVCLAATVLHIPRVSKALGNVFAEIRRVLKAGGVLAILECGKKDLSFGPPLSMRLGPQELEASIAESGFSKSDFIELGFNFLIQYNKT